VVLFYGVIAIHDIPYMIAKGRNHPHQDAIHAAGWVSLFTLHALWPFLWIWAMAYRPERGWGFSHNAPSSTEATELEDLRRRVAELESGLREQGVKRAKLRKAEETVSAPEMIKAGGE
jgi:hypothetical protein